MWGDSASELYGVKERRAGYSGWGSLCRGEMQQIAAPASDCSRGFSFSGGISMGRKKKTNLKMKEEAHKRTERSL